MEGVRGIATGTSFRRLVAKVLARQFSEQVEQACGPFQFALSTRAGTDCVGHAIGVATELNTRLTVLSTDGVGAFDHVFRAAMLSKVAVSLRECCPSSKQRMHAPVRMFGWTKKVCGTPRRPLHAVLFSLGIHDALEEIQQQLEPGESLFAFLDDTYVLCSPERTRVLYNLLNTTLQERAGIRLHTGKTRMWNFAGETPCRHGGSWIRCVEPRRFQDLGNPCGAS